MRIEPATIDQIRRAADGRMVMISADVGGVADDLRRIDPNLRVRFAENASPPFWAVYEETDDGRVTRLVTTCQAYQNRLGVWEGLDQRLVRRIREIDPEGGYNYADALERQARQAKRDLEHRRRERFGELGEAAAHAIRKDLGERYKGRAFIERKP